MSTETKVTYLPVSAIKVDPACQARAEINTETVNEYAEVMKERGDESFPAIVVFHDGADYWLSDGFHRHQAAMKVKLDCLKSRIRSGGRREAILNSVGTNTNHGLRRTNADKRRAVSILLHDEEWSTWGNREIARRCSVDEGLVRKLKEEQGAASVSADCPQIARKVERNGTTFEMKTSNIGKKDGGAEPTPLPPARNEDPQQVSDETAQLQELVIAWSRASEEVRQRFVAIVGISQAGPRLTEPEPFREPSTTEPQENPLFEMWKGLKSNTQRDSRRWVIDGCPSEYRDSHFTITERLEPFRAAALAATEPERDQFLELSGAMTV